MNNPFAFENHDYNTTWIFFHSISDENIVRK